MADPTDPDLDAYHELSAYTMAHGSPDFIHQHVVDAHAAQRADARSKPVAVAFALAGLYLHLERGLTGRQVQRAHMALSKRSRTWPTFAPPAERGSITAADVLAAPAGPERDRAIEAWCAAVWAAYRESRAAVVAMLAGHGIA
jgi:hypothetical protein